VHVRLDLAVASWSPST